MGAMTSPLALLEKYCLPGPRYTSYPTAPYFHTGFTSTEWEETLRGQGQCNRPLSVYVHLPFCESLCYYCGCNMVVSHDYQKAEHYLAVLKQEVQLVASRLGTTQTVKQLHWGGGTPTYLRPEDIRQLADFLASIFHLDKDAEIACEMDPRRLSQSHIEALRASGFNRVSLGIQDLQPEVQAAINRVQPLSVITDVCHWIRQAGMKSLNFDLMIGLPHQTVQTFTQTLDHCIALQPDRFAVFNYAHVPWMKKHQKLIREETLPSFTERLALQQLTLDKLQQAGYAYIGMDHFAKTSDELWIAQKNKTLWRNFQGYTTHKDMDILAFGASAISQTENVYAQNLKNLPEYQQAIEQGRLPIEKGLLVTKQDQLHRAAITHILCDLEIDKRAFEKKWNIVFDAYFHAALIDFKEMEKDGLLLLGTDTTQVTEIGRLFLRNIAMCLDFYLKNSVDSVSSPPRYSKTV